MVLQYFTNKGVQTLKIKDGKPGDNSSRGSEENTLGKLKLFTPEKVHGSKKKGEVCEHQGAKVKNPFF